MNKNRKTKSFVGTQLFTAIVISALFMGGSDAIASKAAFVSINKVAEQLQAQPISGMTVDAKGETIIGASILEKGTSNGTISDIDGKFSLNVKPGATLVVSYVGFKTQEVKAAKSMKIVLVEDSELLQEIVVIGYGSQKKENLTGAVSSVNVTKTLGSRPIADVGRGLQGAVAGLSVVVASGEVGSDPTMKIRGQIGSYRGNSSPLILLDNVEIPSIQMVNPDDIESISVLKDAASASIYGAKAAFGVVLITSKKGAKMESMSVSYSSNFAWQNPSQKIDMAGIDGLEYTLAAQENRNSPMPAGGFWRIDRTSFERSKEWQEKYGNTIKPTDPVVYNRDWYFDGTNKYGVRLYDPQEVMVREWAPSQTHNLSVNGKNGKTSYNIGLGVISQNGMMKPAKHDDFTRYNASVSVTSDISKYLTIRGGAIYSDRNKRYPAFGSSSADPWLYVYRWSRLFPIGVTENGLPLRESAYEAANSGDANIQNKYYSVNLGATVNITRNWDVRFDYTYSNQQENKNSSMPAFRAGGTWYAPVAWTDVNGNQIFVDDEGNATNDGGVAAYQFPQAEYYSQTTTSYIENTRKAIDNNVINVYSTYNLKLGNNDEHVFKYMLGMNRVTGKWNSSTGKRNDLIDYENPQFNYAIGDQFASADQNWDAQLGFFGRINYMFKDRYMLEGNLRYDGSSKFPTDLQWRWFPSFSAGWVISNEKFMKQVDPIWNFAKLRVSWGVIGDQSIPNTKYKSILKGSSSNWIDGNGKQAYMFGTPNVVASDITWQDIETLDFGFDFRFFRDQLGITGDWYQRKTKNMIIGGDALPSTFGADAPEGNYGNLRTRGWEISIDFNHRFSNGIGINAMGTLADATTLVTKGADYMTSWENRNLDNAWSTGRRYGDIYGYVTDRLYQKEDFVYGSDGKIVKDYIIFNGTGRYTNKQTANNPIYQVLFEDGNNVIFSPGDTKYVDLDGDGYITYGAKTNGNPGDRKVIGNSTPRYEYGLRVGADYKGFDVSVFLQGVAKRQIWGSGQLAIPGYNAKEGAMPQTFAGDFWRENRTDAFYPRAWDLGGADSGYSMLVQTRYLLDMAYLRVKNITVGYSLPEDLMRKVHITKARFYVSLENFFTFDKLRGLPIDPEVVSGSSMFRSDNEYNMGRTGTGTPTFKTASVGVQLTF